MIGVLLVITGAASGFVTAVFVELERAGLPCRQKGRNRPNPTGGGRNLRWSIALTTSIAFLKLHVTTMKASDRALRDELLKLAAGMDPRAASTLHAAAQRLRELSKSQPAPPKLHVTPPITHSTQRASLQPKGGAHGR